jgi:hypothetical protein
MQRSLANACDLEREFLPRASLATKTIEMCGPRNGHTATLAAEGAGIAATLFAFRDMADGPLGADPYNNLLAFAEQHPEGGSIGKLL